MHAVALTYVGATPRQNFSAVKGFAFSGSATAARRITARPAEAMVQPNVVHHITTTRASTTWGIDRIDQRPLPLSGTHRIRFSYNEFGGRASIGFDAIDAIDAIDGGSADAHSRWAPRGYPWSAFACSTAAPPSRSSTASTG